MTKNVKSLVLLRSVVANHGRDGNVLMLTVPVHVAEHVEHLVGRAFSCELTDEGILYRLAPEAETAPIKAPAWAKNGEAPDG